MANGNASECINALADSQTKTLPFFTRTKPTLTSATSSVKAIFSLHVVTAVLAFVLFILAVTLTIVKSRRRTQKRSGSDGKLSPDRAPLKSSLATQLFLVPALLCLSIAYATQSATAALQANRGRPVTVTSAYDYRQSTAYSDRSLSFGAGSTIANLSFTNALAAILFTVLLTGAVWLHASNLTNNGTGTAQPKMLSKIWNTFILFVMFASGVASWARGLYVRESNLGACSYSDAIERDTPTRAVFIVFRCLVILASTSVSVEVITKYTSLKHNGFPGNRERPLLARFTFAVVPLIWLRNLFIILDIVLLYVNAGSWSRTPQQAVALLLIVFGELDNLTILFMVLWGSWSMGRSIGKSDDIRE